MLFEQKVIIIARHSHDYASIVGETDASDYGIGVVLIQDGAPLAFPSRALGLRNGGISTYANEFITILPVVDQ